MTLGCGEPQRQTRLNVRVVTDFSQETFRHGGGTLEMTTFP